MTSPTRRLSAVLFLAAEGLSLFGNASIGIVLPWLVLTRTGDPTAAATVAGVAGVPAIIATVVAGWLIDHVGQRRMSVFADLGSAVSVALLAVVDMATGLSLGWFIALGVLGALFDVPGMTARETLMARVSRTSGMALDRLAGLRQAVFGVSFLAGPALAGVLLSLMPAINVVWITATCSLLAAVCTMLLPLVAATSDDHQSAEADRVAGGSWADRMGLGMVWSNPTLRAMVFIGFASTVVTAPLLAVLLPAHFQALDQADRFGLTMSAFALGSLVGSVGYALFAVRSRWVTYLTALALLTVGMAGFASLRGFWLVAVGACVVGIGNSLLSPLFLVYFSEQVPDRMRGRVLSLFNALSLVATPVALGGLGLLLTTTSINGAALVVFGLWVAVAIYCVVSPALRGWLSTPVETKTPGVASTPPSSTEPTSERV